MPTFRKVAFAVFGVLFLAVSVGANTYSRLWDEADTGVLNDDERRVIQVALALEGQYTGLLDGIWGPISQRSLELFGTQRFEDRPRNWHLAVLAVETLARFKADGWANRHFPDYSVTVLVPEERMSKAASTGAFENWSVRGTSVSVSFALGDKYQTGKFHTHTRRFHQQPGEPFSVRRPGLAVTSSRNREGRTLYTRSDFIDGRWTTTMIAADPEEQGMLNVFAGSIVPGEAGPLGLPPDGALHELVRLALAYEGVLGSPVSVETGSESGALVTGYDLAEGWAPGGPWTRLADPDAEDRDAGSAPLFTVLPDNATDAETLDRQIETELARIGCDPGKVDGQWDWQAQDALTKASYRWDEIAVLSRSFNLAEFLKSLPTDACSLP